MRLADFVIDFLAKKNIKKVFTVSGGGSIFLCDALFKTKKLKYISCHHEQAVAFAAESYSRLKNKPGAALVTTGPGGTNCLTGVACCWIDSVPTMFISGQVYLDQTIKKTRLRQIGVQEIDIISMVKDFTKYSILIKQPNEILYHLEKAYYETTNGRPGPVWIDIPADIQNTEIDITKLKRFNPPKTTKRLDKLDNQIKKIAQLLVKSKRPVIHIGHGGRISNCEKNLRKLIDRYKIPFALTWNASDLIESSHPSYIGRPGAFAERGSNFIVQNADLYISVGTRLPFMVTGYNTKDFARKAKIVMIDIDSKELKNTRVLANHKLKVDAGYFFDKLVKELPQKIHLEKSWLDYCKEVRKKYPIVLDEYKKQKNSVNSYYFIDILSDLLKPKDVVVTDMGLSFVGTHQAFKVKKGQRVFTNSGHAPMGWGLPAAIGAYYASIESKGKKNIICLTGEGGLQMNIQELATVLHHKIPVKIFIYNNGGYLTIKQTQQLGFKSRIMGSDYESGLSFPNYELISKSHSIKYFKISDTKKIKNLVSKILKINEPVICELILDSEQEQMPKAINRRTLDGRSIPTTFEDMYPFLPKNELKSNIL
jgi:acetolactate synthase I/II/III large subunit